MLWKWMFDCWSTDWNLYYCLIFLSYHYYGLHCSQLMWMTPNTSSPQVALSACSEYMKSVRKMREFIPVGFRVNPHQPSYMWHVSYVFLCFFFVYMYHVKWLILHLAISLSIHYVLYSLTIYSLHARGLFLDIHDVFFENHLSHITCIRSLF